MKKLDKQKLDCVAPNAKMAVFKTKTPAKMARNRKVFNKIARIT